MEKRMEYNRKELKIVEHDFNSISNRLLQSVIDDYPHNLALFINYINKTDIISEYIKKCGEPDKDIAEEVRAVASSYGRSIFDLGDDQEAEVASVYAILSHLNEMNCNPLHGIIRGYELGAKHYDDMLRSFNNRVAAVLINHIDNYLTRIGIEMGTEEKVFQIEVKEGGVAQINIAQDNASVTATQNNGVDLNKLEALIKNLKDSTIDLSDEDRQDVFDSVEVIETEVRSGKPKRGMLTTASNTLKRIAGKVPQAIEFIAAVTEITAFVMSLTV